MLYLAPAFNTVKSLVLTVLVLLSLVGCYQQPGAGQTPSQDVVEFVKTQVARLADRKYEEFREYADPKTFGLESGKLLERMTSLLPKAQPQSVTVVAFFSPQSRQGTDIALEFKYSDRWFLIRASARQEGGRLKLFALSIDELGESAEKALTVSMEGKGTLHYAVLVFAILMPAVVLFAIVQWVRLGKFKFRWWWLIAILFGVTRFTLNWHTGQWSFFPIYFLLFGAGYAAPMELPPLLWPLYISVSIPLGAVLFLIRRRSIAAAKQLATAPN